MPDSARHPASTFSGTRKHVPELMSVVPPTPRPIGIGIAVFPNATVTPPRRYIRRIISTGRPVKSARVWWAPSSRSRTARPFSASDAASGAPPAPVPTTTTSHSRSSVPTASASMIWACQRWGSTAAGSSRYRHPSFSCWTGSSKVASFSGAMTPRRRFRVLSCRSSPSRSCSRSPSGRSAKRRCVVAIATASIPTARARQPRVRAGEMSSRPVSSRSTASWPPPVTRCPGGTTVRASTPNNRGSRSLMPAIPWPSSTRTRGGHAAKSAGFQTLAACRPRHGPGRAGRSSCGSERAGAGASPPR